MSNKRQTVGTGTETKPVRDEQQSSKDPRHIRRDPKSKYIFSYGRALEPKLANPSLAGYYRPWRFTDQKYSGVSKIFYARTRDFRISLDISQFSYENVSVKVTEDHYVLVEGYHDIIEDQLGKVKRRFTRKYKLPPDVKTSTIHGKYKKGFLFLWGEKSLADVENSDIKKIKTDSIVSSKKTHVTSSSADAGRVRRRRLPRNSHQLDPNDVKPLVDARLDKHREAQLKQNQPKHKTKFQEITIPISYSPGSPA